MTKTYEQESDFGHHGWLGIGQDSQCRCHQQAHPEFVSSLYSQYPNTTLVTCGEEVGLPEGQMGDGQVGHLNLGAGRIVYQNCNA